MPVTVPSCAKAYLVVLRDWPSEIQSNPVVGVLPKVTGAQAGVEVAVGVGTAVGQ